MICPSGAHANTFLMPSSRYKLYPSTSQTKRQEKACTQSPNQALSEPLAGRTKKDQSHVKGVVRGSPVVDPRAELAGGAASRS